MKKLLVCSSAVACLCAAIVVSAQPPQDGGAKRGQKGQGGRGGNGNAAMNSDSAVQRIMAMDANGDGILTPDEVTDPRLQNLLQRADTNSDGQVTKAELQAMASAEAANAANGQGGRGGQGGAGMGPPPGGGMGGPRPGEVMPAFVMDQLQLTDAQRQQIAALQQQVDAQLSQILTAEQQQMLLQGPSGGGGGSRGGGQGGFGGPGGGPGGPPRQPNDGGAQSGDRGRGGRRGGQK